MQLTNIEELHEFLKSDQFDFYNFQILSSKIPSVSQNKPCILGVDEAGRGPVLGPMVYAVCYIPKEKACDFEEIGCVDSKTLNEKKREEIFTTLCSLEDYVGWSVDVISPNYISNKMLKRMKYSLNEIAEEATIKLIKLVIESKVNVTEIYVDTVGPPDKYQEKLSKVFPQCKVTVAKKADSTYPIVSGASICAKVVRDATLHNWKFSEKLSFTSELGSGYPNDPQTRTFLKENLDIVFGFPSLVRFSWSTAAKILEDCVVVQWDEESSSPMKKESITSFFRTAIETTKHEMNHHFFKQRNLANINYF